MVLSVLSLQSKLVKDSITSHVVAIVVSSYFINSAGSPIISKMKVEK